MSVVRRLGSALLLAGVLASCTSQVPDLHGAPSPSEPSANEVAPARVGQCYPLGLDDLDDPSSDVEAVSCSQAHTAKTVSLLRTTPRATAASRCARSVALHLGTTPSTLRETMVEPLWYLVAFGPRGRLRCDFVVFTRSEQLLDLPKQTRGLFRRLSFGDSLRICGTAKPGGEGFERVSCGNSHAWRVVEALDLTGRGYPGAKELREQGDRRCADRVREEHAFALKFAYGWEWPNREQWNAGQRYGLCWTTD
jgi:hypothetical protein